MFEKDLLCGRDVDITIDGRKLLQAEKAELKVTSELYRVRSCFCSEDKGYAERRREHKLSLTGVRFRQPFENCNFYDLDNFTVTLQLDGQTITLEGCMWEDYMWTAEKERFREHISIIALRMRREEQNEGS